MVQEKQALGSLSAALMKSETSEVLQAITILGQNLQRVLMAPQRTSHLGNQDFLYHLANQASFTANFLEIQSQDKIGHRRANVTSPTPLEVILKKKQELSSLGRKKSSDQSYFEEHSKVPQAKSKDMSSGKEQTNLPRSFTTNTDQLTTTFSAKETCEAHKLQAPATKTLPSTLVSSDPASTLHATNGAIIESQVHASNVIG